MEWGEFIPPEVRAAGIKTLERATHMTANVDSQESDHPDSRRLREVVALVVLVAPMSYREYKDQMKRWDEFTPQWSLLRALRSAVEREGVYPGDMTTQQIFPASRILEMAGEAIFNSKCLQLGGGLHESADGRG